MTIERQYDRWLEDGDACMGCWRDEDGRRRPGHHGTGCAFLAKHGRPPNALTCCPHRPPAGWLSAFVIALVVSAAAAVFCYVLLGWGW